MQLSDLGTIITGKTPTTKKEEYWNGFVPFVTPGDIQGVKHIFKTARYVTDAGMQAVKGAILPKNAVCVSCIGNIGYVGVTTKQCISNQQINSIIVSEDHNHDYVYYLMKSLWPFFKHYEGQSTTLSILNKTQFSHIEVPDFTRIQEDRIAETLCALDEKIEHNNAINENLEQQAQTLFKSWFLDYDPWNGIVPDSWINGKLGDFADIKRGGSPRPIQEYLSDSGLRWLKISDVTSLQTPFVIDIKDHIIEEGMKKTVFLKAGSLVLSNSATPGVPKILDVDSCIHDGWLYFPESKFSKEYLYLYFKYIRQQLVNLSNGSVFNNLKTDILKGYPTILPDSGTLRRFDTIVRPMFLQMQNLTRESHKLADMRDAILPRLMSGELDVSNLDL